eukprot:1009424-Rhodomonas_salina.1
MSLLRALALERVPATLRLTAGTSASLPTATSIPSTTHATRAPCPPLVTTALHVHFARKKEEERTKQQGGPRGRVCGREEGKGGGRTKGP